MRKICVITGSRAEYGLLRWVMQDIKNDPNLELQIIVTGMHLSPVYGCTYHAIEEDKFRIDRKVEMLMSSDTSVGIAKSMGLGLIGFADALNDLQPDMVVVLGDRFEIFSAVAAALVAQVPVAHIHGGESTEGLIDESIRHSITKMSQIHFVAAEEYRRRVIQLGEDPDKVFLVGGLGIDSMQRLQLLDKVQLEREINFKFGLKNLLITFHPVTLEKFTAESQLSELLSVLAELQDTKLIFTLPNAEANSHGLIKMVLNFVECNDNAFVFTSLGQLNYFSCIPHVDAVIGNSSSGLLEVPSFKKCCINIGDRQRGRLKADSVIDCEPTYDSIRSAIRRLYSADFQESLNHVVSPYGEGGASQKILSVIKEISLDGILKKKFYVQNKLCE